MRKCDIDKQSCGEGRFCKYDPEDITVGICAKKRVKDCKIWEAYAKKEICKTCVDGFELDLSTKQKCVSMVNNWVIPVRRLLEKK